MNEEDRIKFAGLMEEYLNIPSFVCELIEKQLEDNKYKEVIEYVVQRRNEIENKEDYLSEQEKINLNIDLQQKVEQLENKSQILEENNKLLILQKAQMYEDLDNISDKLEQLENIRKEAIEYIDKQLNNPMAYERNVLKNTFNILNKGGDKE